MAEDKRARRIASYVNRKVRPLTPRHRAVVEAHLPRLSPPEGDVPLSLETLFPENTPEELWLEIGFGGGEHLCALAKANPHMAILGAEPFLDGLARAVMKIANDGIDNVRLYRGDARELIDRMPDGAISRAFILFPDPWPKRRHHKRRLVQPEFVRDLSRILRPGGQLRLATDVESYADQALSVFLRNRNLDWTAERASDWRDAPADHVPTRYQEKGLGDIRPVYFDFKRV